MKATITWLPKDAFTTVILYMDFAPHAEYSDVVLCGAFAGIKNCPMDGLAITRNSMSLSRNLNYKQTHPTMPIWNGFHTIVFVMGDVMIRSCMVYLLVHMLN